MHAKIAITSPKILDRVMLSRALSRVTAIPLLTYKTEYEWCRHFRIDYLRNTLEWQQMLLISASSFIEGLEVEANYPQFISDGATFGLLVQLMLQGKYPGCRLQAEKDKIFKALMNACFKYAATKYDCVIHLNSQESDLHEPYVEIFEKYKIAYRVYQNNDMKILLRCIIQDLNLPIKQSIDKTILHMEENIFY